MSVYVMSKTTIINITQEMIEKKKLLPRDFTWDKIVEFGLNAAIVTAKRIMDLSKFQKRSNRENN